MNPDEMEQQKNREDVIYVLRTVHQNQSHLNGMADQKANILVGVIVLLLTFLLTRLTAYELTQQQLWITICFIVLEAISMFLGIMVIRPRTSWANNSLTIEQMPNPLFFGFFTRYSEQQYMTYMQQTLVDNQVAHKLLLKDIYQIGQVLKRKYTLLKYAYLFAVSGIFFAVSAVLFFIAEKS